MRKTRLELNDSIMDVVVKMVEGNPGATSVCTQLLKDNKEIDPDSALGEMGSIFSLDGLGIYGHRIWRLYKDVCGEDIAKTVGILRANQLGFVSESNLNQAIDNRGYGLNLDSLIDQVKERLPNFDSEEKVI